MGLKGDNKVIFLVTGILFSWFALGIMFSEFHKGEFNIELDSVFIMHGWLILWFICIAISSILLGLSVKARKIG